MALRRYELTVRGPLARDVLDVVRARFDAVSSPCAHVLVVDGIDQASVRALLILLWDSGHELLAVSSCASDHPG